MQPPKAAGNLAVGGQRVRQAREPEHRRVRGRQEGERRQRADHVLEALREPVRMHLGDDPDHGVVQVARRQLGVAVVHRQRRDRHHRDAHVPDHDRGRAAADHLAQPRTADPHLARQSGGGLQARERDRGDRQGEDESRPRRRAAEMDRPKQRVRVEEQRQAEHDDQQLQQEIADHQHCDPPGTTTAETADVGEHHPRDERQRQQQRLGPVAQRMPEHAQVLGRRVGGDGDQDRVVQQDRPTGDEADELVERVSREHGRSTAILVQGRALDVGERGEREEQRGEQEHERRQAEGVTGDHAQREVDRAGKRRVDDREQPGRADAPPGDHPRARGQFAAGAIEPLRSLLGLVSGALQARVLRLLPGALRRAHASLLLRASR